MYVITVTFRTDIAMSPVEKLAIEDLLSDIGYEVVTIEQKEQKP